MIRRIETAFGSMLDDKDMTYIVSSAWIIREGLRKDYNGDQPSSPPNGVSPRAIETSRSENKGDGGDYGDARGEHQHFREVKAGKYRYFRHGTSLKYPTPMLGNLPTEAEL